MGPVELLQKVAKILPHTGCRFAVAGGIASNYFRQEPRLTNDVDLVLLAKPVSQTQRAAVQLVEELGLHAGLAKASDLSRAPRMNKKNSPVVMVIGRKEKNSKETGLDILLPAMPWIEKAIERAERHLIDYGFAKLPTLTPEDLILSKAFALRDNPSRFKDMDDVQAIFASTLRLDLAYLASEFERHQLSLPRELEKLAPKALQRASKKTRAKA